MPKASNSAGKPVPGGSTQKTKATYTHAFVASRTRASGNTGSNRGLVGSGTIDRHGRTPAQQDRASGAPGNFGGGVAGTNFQGGRRSAPSSRRRG